MRKKICSILAGILFCNMLTSFCAFAENTEPAVQMDESSAVTAEAAEDIISESSNVVNLYVSQDKSEAANSNTFSSIDQALSEARKHNKTEKKVIINIKSGTYDVTNTISLTANDNGSSDYPLIIRGDESGEVVINAGKRIVASKLDSKDTVRSRFPAVSRDRIYKIDLSDYDAAEIGTLPITNLANGAFAGIDIVPAAFYRLVYDNETMTMARFPNTSSDFVDVASNTDNGGAFTVENADHLSDISAWKPDGNGFISLIAANGYMNFNFNFTGYDTATGMITLDSYHERLAKGARVRFYNLPEMLDAPGEYVIDVQNKAAYFYPPQEALTGELYLTTMRKPILSMEKTSNIIIEGITFANGGSHAITMNQTENCSIKNCVIKNTMGSGMEIQNCKNTLVSGCTISALGMHGISLVNGGNALNLTSGGNIVEKCDIYDIGQLTPVGKFGILLKDEVGAVIRNNRVHNTPHTAIMLNYATDNLIEKNEIYNAVNDTYDAGAVYAGAAKTIGVGNVYKNNYFHDIKLAEDARYGNTMALYWDDQISGQTAYGNIFANDSFALLAGGGDWNTIENNIFFKSTGSVTYDNRGEGWQAVVASSEASQYDRDIGANMDAWFNKFPHMKTIYDYLKAGDDARTAAPDLATIKNNLIISSGTFGLTSSVKKYAVEVANNYQTENTKYISFADYDNFNFQYDENTEIKDVPDFEYIDFSQIGLPEKKELGKVEILGPKNGAENLEGNNILLYWKDCNGADKYRVKIAMDPDMVTLFYDEVVQGRRLALDNLKYGRTFYFTVEPVVASKSENAGYVSDVYSFTTTATEKKDTSKLEKLLEDLGNGWKKVKEGARPGQYREGAVSELEKVVDEAETVLYDNTSKMYSVKRVTGKLDTAITNFYNKMNTETVEIGSWLKDTAGWNGTAEITNGVLQLGPQKFYAYKNAQLTRGQLLKFKAKFDFTNYDGFGFNQQDSEKNFAYSPGYSLVIKRAAIEIQKRYRLNGKNYDEIIKTIGNDENKMTSDVWYTVETGVLSTASGPRIVLKIDGETIVDYIDTAGNAPDDLGYFSFYHSIGDTGMFIAPSDYNG